MATMRTTIWLGEPDGDDTAEVAVSREDDSVMIATRWPPGDLEIMIDPSLFDVIRAAMARAEDRTRQSTRPRPRAAARGRGLPAGGKPD